MAKKAIHKSVPFQPDRPADTVFTPDPYAGQMMGLHNPGISPGGEKYMEGSRGMGHGKEFVATPNCQWPEGVDESDMATVMFWMRRAGYSSIKF